MEQKIRDVIRQSDMILIGIGDEFRPDISIGETEENKGLEQYLYSRACREIPDDALVIQAYNRLQELIKGKPYFVVTMNTDDVIYRSALNPEYIVAPCGSMRKMQCAEHIVEAEPVVDAVLQAKDPGMAVCPECQKPLQFHLVSSEGYLESGYLPQWENYTKFLQFTLKQQVCILELGVGFKYPQVIRFPFEKTTYYNKKATLVRVNSKFSQLPAELAGKGFSVAQSPVDFLMGI